MSLAPTLLLTVAGLVMIAVALRDIFDVLFHLEGRASASRAITRGVWRVLRRAADVRPQMFALAGPVALLSVIATWTLLILVGWALLLWPHLASFQDPAGEPARGGFLEALYISTGTLSTMGYGDVTPVEQWLRVVAPLEALIGFGLLTASVTWLFAVHPAVQRHRALAYELWLLRKATEGELGPPVVDEQLLSELTSRVIAIERDIVAIPASYYFRESDDRFLLAAQLPFMRSLASERMTAGEDAATVQRACMLRTAIDDLLKTMARRLHGLDDIEADEALDVFARDHLKREPPTETAELEAIPRAMPRGR